MIYTEEKVLSEIRRLTRRDLRVWVREGWVRPAMSESGPLFDDIDVARLRLVCDLRQEMALTSDAVHMVLSLIDRLHQTRRDMRMLLAALDDQPREVRHAVASRFRAQLEGDAPEKDR
ncbi:chaperone modulatory protein CbpM [Lutimaribacter pacificus]|uniref:Chaperone modulatory protein CbpM n=1 Tax=Lutimaribacter pacificus TaxID=391948 RepID=A0A1H0NM36_9RHOB|nr:MerR family transcriptional regulator [Lutimaribacter pacificus]SDO93701.1 chaperone modulatory protein CbpM [Lutimaribacter pacificus]SHK88041.1 chaperone modulatory protein CbpM [Lutimaribacter pacificus]